MHLLWRKSFVHEWKVNLWQKEKVCVWHWSVWNELTDSEQIAEWTPSFSLARAAHCVSMTVYMSCWHNALYDGGTASSLLLCTASALEVRYAQLTLTDEKLDTVKTVNTLYQLSSENMSSDFKLMIWENVFCSFHFSCASHSATHNDYTDCDAGILY